MKHKDDEWLRQQVLEDLNELAEERERLLLEAKELQGIHMPEERLADIHRELERRQWERRKKAAQRPKIHVAAILAAVLVTALGAGFVGSGHKLYLPEIFQRERGKESTTKVNNSEAVASEYDEEEICREIQDKLGVLPVRLGYRPKGMKLVEYKIRDAIGEAFIRYEHDRKYLRIYISKDYSESSINFEVDGELVDTMLMLSSGLEVSVYKYKEDDDNEYYGTSFEYLSTYYSVYGMISQDEFEQVLENIIIKNV